MKWIPARRAKPSIDLKARRPPRQASLPLRTLPRLRVLPWRFASLMAPQSHQCNARAAVFGLGFAAGFDVRVRRQELAQGSLAGAFSVAFAAAAFGVSR